MGGIGKLIAGVVRKAYRYVRYGKQIGKVHADGSTLHKGNSLFGTPGTKYVVGKKGDVKKVITRERVGKSCFRVTQAVPKKSDSYIRRNEWDVTRTIYSNEPRGIGEFKFIGKYSPKWNNWGLSRGNTEYKYTPLK